MRPVSAWQWFALGVMAAYTPSIGFLALVLWRVPDAIVDEEPAAEGETPEWDTQQ